MSDKERAEQWMRKNKSILPGPLTDGDWEQIRALLEKYAAEVAVECRAPAPQPDIEAIRELIEFAKGNNQCTAEDNCAECELVQPLIRRIEASLAATPQVAPAGTYFCFECDNKNRCASAETCYAGHSGYPRRTVEGTSEQVREFKPYMEDHEYYDPPQASPTPDKCPTCGSKDYWTALPACHGGIPDSWHSSAPKGTK